MTPPPPSLCLRVTCFTLYLLGLSVSAWNINGAYSSLLGNKLDQEGFLSKMKKMGFFAVCETWTRDTNVIIP